MFKNTQREQEKQAKSEQLEKELFGFLAPLMKGLNHQMDRRLVMTFFGVVIAIMTNRHRNNGLLLSELGSYLLVPENCVAGTKRISKLIHSNKWKAKSISV